ncbi:hypothetical protein MBLNU459_g4844t1 [Dothideomycetes sp. NU459]
MSSDNGRNLSAGVYCAILTFFDEAGGLDIPAIRGHATYLVKSGITGLVAMGSNGEMPHLTRDERQIVTREIRSALADAGFFDVPIIVGCSDQSVHGTVLLIRDAEVAGADAALVLPPSYFRPAVSDALVENFYRKVADASPLPIILYSYPDVTAGVKMDSDLLIKVSQHPRIVGTKFTCGDTGKLARVSASMNAATPLSACSGYLTLGGLADFALQALVAGGSGYIAGGANIAPRTCVKVYELFREGKFKEAMKQQRILSEGDWHHTKAGIAATKAIVQKQHGYGGIPREPLSAMAEESATELLTKSHALLDWERSLGG